MSRCTYAPPCARGEPAQERKPVHFEECQVSGGGPRRRLVMNPPVNRELQVPTGSSFGRPTLAPKLPDPEPSRSSGPWEGAAGLAGGEPRRSFAGARGFLARLIPRRGGRTGTTHDAEFEFAERRAYQSALELWSGVPLTPALPAPRSVSAQTPGSAASMAPRPGTPGRAADPPARPAAPSTTRESASAPGPAAPRVAAPRVAAPSRDDPATSAEVRISSWAAPPTLSAERSARPEGRPVEVPPTMRRRRKLGETAPDSLLQAPPCVTLAADDFFDGLMRQVRGDR